MNGANVRKNGMKRVMTMVSPAVFGKEMVELAHAFRRERFHFAGIDDAHAEEPRDPVIRRVAQDSGNVEHDERSPDVQPSTVGREHARREQQRIARQKREEHKTRLHEHDEKQRRVHPQRPQRDDPARDSPPRIREQVDEEIDDVHVVLAVTARYKKGISE